MFRGADEDLDSQFETRRGKYGFGSLMGPHLTSTEFHKPGLDRTTILQERQTRAKLRGAMVHTSSGELEFDRVDGKA